MSQQIKPLSFRMSLLCFGIPTLILLTATWLVMPWLQMKFHMLPVLSWFVAGGVLVFIPLFVAGIMAARREAASPTIKGIMERLRLKKMDRRDWLWAIGGLLLVFIGNGLIVFLFEWLASVVDWIHPLGTQMPFMEYHGLESGQEWVLLIWLIFFFFNIVGEEICWRGYILPRQERRFGKHAWLINGALWTVFHLAFGLDLMIMLLPIMFLQPWIVQKRQNTWIGIFIHSVYNGPIFVAISLNWIN